VAREPDLIYRAAMRTLIMLGALAVPLTAGCASHYRTVALVPIRHVVVLDLKDAADYREFGKDCFQLLFVPGVVNILTGPGLDTGQAQELPCGAAMVLDMQDSETCHKLPEAPAYAALLEKWRPKSRSIRVVSFGPRCEEPAPGDSAAPTARP